MIRVSTTEQTCDAANQAALQAMQDQAPVWYAFQTTPLGEWRAQSILAQLGMPAYICWSERMVRTTRHTKPRPIRIKIMPRLLFVAFKPGRERFMQVLSVGPVTGVIGMAGVPRGMTGATLHAFIARISGADHPDMPPAPVFHPGDKARITDGAMAGRVVEVTQIRGDKARVLAEVLGSMHEVEVRRTGLEAVA